MRMLGGRIENLRMASLTVTVALVVALGACGSDGDDDTGGTQAVDSTKDVSSADTTPEGQVRAAFKAMMDAIYESDYRAACRMSTASVRKELGGKKFTCVEFYDTFLGGKPPQSTRPVILALKVQGNKATLRTKPVEDSTPVITEWVKRGDKWLMATSGDSPQATGPGPQ